MTELHTEPLEEEQLSTADLAAAGRRPSPEPESGQDRVPQEENRVENRAISIKTAEPRAALFREEESQSLRSEWDAIQTGFVDDPRQAVEQADQLVARAIKRLAEIFAGERNQLEQQWSRGDDVSTEDLRVALQRYRSFFDRLLSV